MVAPPRVVPMTMDNLLTGATRTSCRNPNCLSQRMDSPMKTEGNIIDITIIPGARTSIYVMPEGNPENIAPPKPKPSTERKKNGCMKFETSLPLSLTNLFSCLSQIT